MIYIFSEYKADCYVAFTAFVSIMGALNKEQHNSTPHTAVIYTWVSKRPVKVINPLHEIKSDKRLDFIERQQVPLESVMNANLYLKSLTSDMIF